MTIRHGGASARLGGRKMRALDAAGALGRAGGWARAAVFGVVVLGAGLASAQAPGGGPPPPPDGAPPFHRHGGPPPFDRILERHADRLGLDDGTRARVRSIADASRPEGERLRADLEARRREMRDLLGADAPDEAAVMAQAERIGAAETALQKQRLRTMLEIRAILSPEQRAELVKIHAERKERWKGWKRGGRPEGGPDGPGEPEGPPPAP